jgi:hypothetical protein
VDMKRRRSGSPALSHGLVDMMVIFFRVFRLIQPLKHWEPLSELISDYFHQE